MNISKDEKKVLSYWLIVIIIILIIVFLLYKSKEHINELDKNARIQLTYSNTNNLTDRNVYYTAKNVVSKYYSYINMKKHDSLLIMLNENYKKDNKITLDNLKNKFNYSKNVYFDTNEIMCVKKIKDSVIIVDIKGKEFSNDEEINNEVYYEVELNYNNDTFNISVINESSYSEVCNEKR